MRLAGPWGAGVSVLWRALSFATACFFFFFFFLHGLHGPLTAHYRAWGVLAWEVTHKCSVPYGAISLAEIALLLTSGQRLSFDDGVPGALQALVLQTWREAAEERPSPATILLEMKKVVRSAVVGCVMSMVAYLI